MKKGLLISLLFLTNLAMAGEIPNCWDRPEIEDGTFLITFSANDVTKQQLVEILNRANGRHIEARQYPIVMDDLIIIAVQAADSGVGEYRLSREELKQAVREELTPIAEIKGVNISCNGIVRPLPRPGPH
ncbi:MAG: hypothetical protein AAB309_06860 [Deltaproteobacteria bacterium]